jgi:hypothetical protein
MKKQYSARKPSAILSSYEINSDSDPKLRARLNKSENRIQFQNAETPTDRKDLKTLSRNGSEQKQVNDFLNSGQLHSFGKLRSGNKGILAYQS